MNYFKGYKKKGKRRDSLVGFVGEYTKGSLAFSIGSQVVSQPQFGAIGQQGAAGLAVGASFLPSIATIGVGGYTVRKLKGLSRSRRKK